MTKKHPGSPQRNRYQPPAPSPAFHPPIEKEPPHSNKHELEEVLANRHEQEEKEHSHGNKHKK